MATDEDRQHWSQVGCDYSQGWETPARQRMSRREIDFVLRHARRTRAQRVLDIGVGNGRILEALLTVTPPEGEVYGVDVSDEMLAATRQRLSPEPRLEGLHLCDISQQELPVSGSFDVITAVRILKYSQNWPSIVARLGARLTPGGVFIFSVSNGRSLNRLSRPYAVRTHHATARQVQNICRQPGLEVVEFSGSTKLPYSAYTSSSSTRRADVLLSLEDKLDAWLGRTALTRELFVAVTPSEAMGA